MIPEQWTTDLDLLAKLEAWKPLASVDKIREPIEIDGTKYTVIATGVGSWDLAALTSREDWGDVTWTAVQAATAVQNNERDADDLRGRLAMWRGHLFVMTGEQLVIRKTLPAGRPGEVDPQGVPVGRVPRPAKPDQHLVAIVGCGKSKLDHAAPARELYTGNLFRAAARDVESRGLPWFIASARAGLVTPDQMLQTYDQELRADEAEGWAEDVAFGLLEHCRKAGIERQGGVSRGGNRWVSDVPGLVVELHMGARYADPLHAELPRRFPGIVIEEPSAGLEIGLRLAFYKGRADEQVLVDELSREISGDTRPAIEIRAEAARELAAMNGPSAEEIEVAIRHTLALAHEYANLFPMMAPTEIAALAADIQENGQSDEIVMYAGKILDGRNRWAAMGLLGKRGVGPVYVEFDGDDEDALRFALSRNLLRRHLDEAQRAMVGARMLPLYKAAAAKRQEASRSKPGQQVGTVAPIEGKGKAAAAAAEASGSKTRSVELGMAILRDGVPELAAAVDRGHLDLTAAANIARAPAEEQRAVIALDDEAAIRKAAREIMQRQKAANDTKRHKKRVEQLQIAGAAAPNLRGVDLRCCTSMQLLVDLPDGVAALTHADPPWSYSRQVGNGTTDRHYETSMTMEDIVADLEAAYQVAADDSYLLLWCTGPILPEWLEAARGKLSWRYLSKGSWHKTDGMGAGVHWRGDSEDLLLYAKGNPRPLMAVSNSYASERQDHSEKPEGWIRKLIDAFAPEGSLVVDLYAGRAPVARVCAANGRRCVAAESDPKRHAEAMELLCPPAPLFAATGT